jgi:hypothetical protein
VNRPRSKPLTLLIASIEIAVLVGAAFASRAVILTACYAHRLRSENVDMQSSAVASLRRLRTRLAARVLVDFLRDTGGRIQREIMLALKDIGDVALEPLAEAFQAANDFEGRPEPIQYGSIDPVFSGVEAMLEVLLEMQRKDTGVNSLLEHIGSTLTEPPVDKELVWKSRVLTIEGRPCRVFLFNWPGSGWFGPPQTILLTDVGGRVITWKDIEGMPFFSSCELETSNGVVLLVVTREETKRESPGKYIYRLTLRGIEDEK